VLKVNEGRYVKDRKFYDKAPSRKVQWQRKLQFLAKEGEDILVQQGPHKTLQRNLVKPTGASDED